jgi:hypothetical protein
VCVFIMLTRMIEENTIISQAQLDVKITGMLCDSVKLTGNY